MKLKEYLRVRKIIKTGKTSKWLNSLSGKEARAIGVPYPLQRGWVEKYADNDVPESIHSPVVPKQTVTDAALLFVLAVHAKGYEACADEFADLEEAILAQE